MIKLSIITINFNNRKGLKKTITSVINQTFIDYEYIIIDGGSTDGSVEEIKQVADKLVYWVSQPDNGIYHAMNKGIKKASGDYCLFLNSGDCLVDNNVLTRIFDLKLNEDIIYSDVIIGRHINRYPVQLDITFFLARSLCHQSTLLKKDLFDKYGLYNENLKISADWEFILRMILLNGCSYKYLDFIILSKIEMGGISLSKKYIESQQNERDSVLRNYLIHIITLKAQNDTGQHEIIDVFLKYSHLKESVLIRLAHQFETTSFFFLLRYIYHRLKK